MEDANDYMLDHPCFSRLDRLCGPHTVDRFASEKTAQVARFCSRFLNPGCEAADAFTVSWAGVNNWLFPPPLLGALCVTSHSCGWGGWYSVSYRVAVSTLAASAGDQAWYLEEVCHRCPADSTLRRHLHCRISCQ